MQSSPPIQKMLRQIACNSDQIGRITVALTKESIEKYKSQLLQLKAKILHKLAETDEEVKEMVASKGYSQHQADEGSDDFDQAIALQLSDEDRSILRKIDRALEKIEEGTFGICEVCGKEISEKRLDAIPYAVTTLRCQEEREKRKEG